MFWGAAHVTRTLLVEPDIPATAGIAGADGASRTLSTVIVTDFAADAVLPTLPVVHFHRQRVALPRLRS